jgi:hypothetical protein
MSEIGPNQILFNQQNNIKSDAIALALNMLQMHNIEFTSLSLDELKKTRSNISNNGLINSALNILIFYKLEDGSNELPKQQISELQINPSIRPSIRPFIKPQIGQFNDPSFDIFDPFNSFPKINRINTNTNINTNININTNNIDQNIRSSNDQLNRQFI